MKYLPLFYIFFIGSIFSITKFETYTAEASVAYIINASDTKVKPNPQPSPVPECECNGTGRVKTGDGINTTECPCGKGCSCKNKNTPTILNKRVLFFTDRSHCAPCKRTEKKTFPLLKDKGWKIGVEDTNIIQIIDNTANNAALFQSYDIQARGVPTFILLENEKVVRINTGFMTCKEFGIFFYGK